MINIYFRYIYFIIGFLLSIDGIVLIALRKIHLGTLLPLFIGIFFIFYAIYCKRIQKYLNQHLKIRPFWRIGWCLFILWFISLIGFFIYLDHAVDKKYEINHLDAIIVLGSGIEKNKPSAVLAKRLDAAAIIGNQYPNAVMVMTGGIGFGKTRSEAEVMSEYLQENYYINSEKILLEDKSTSTELNLKNSQKILRDHDLNANAAIAIVTSDFHTLRSEAIAKKLGYKNIRTIAAETPLLTRYNSWLREYFAYISGWVLREY